jgi:predicted nuclease of predicted toxin-antitoxin system
MRILADQDVWASTVRLLRDLGHDVTTAADAGLSRATDVELLQAAQKARRLLVTRDRDFGALVFLKDLGAGVVYLRMAPGDADLVHAQLRTVLSTYDEEVLREAFVVVESGRYRFRGLGR